MTIAAPSATAQRPLTCVQIIASISDAGAGPSYSVTALADGLARLGVNGRFLTVAGWRAGGAAPETTWPVEAHDWDFRRTPGLRALCLSAGLARALTRAASTNDILHTHGLWLAPNIYPALAARKGQTPVVISPRGMLGREALAFSRGRKALVWTVLQRPALEAATCLHATSEAEFEAIRDAGLRTPVAVIPNGVDVPAAAPAGTGRRRTVLSLGRVHPKKGLDELVRAWAAIEPTNPEWRLRIVGPSELGHAEELRRLANSLDLKSVSIEGPAFGVARETAFTEAGLFVLPTRNENFAMTVAEALARGVPVISTKGAPWSGLETNACGWWVDRGPVPIAAALDKALKASDGERERMGRNGRAWMARDFSWDRVAGDMQAVYRWAAGLTAAPATVRGARG